MVGFRLYIAEYDLRDDYVSYFYTWFFALEFCAHASTEFQQI